MFYRVSCECLSTLSFVLDRANAYIILQSYALVSVVPTALCGMLVSVWKEIYCKQRANFYIQHNFSPQGPPSVREFISPEMPLFQWNTLLRVLEAVGLCTLPGSWSGDIVMETPSWLYLPQGILYDRRFFLTPWWTTKQTQGFLLCFLTVNAIQSILLRFDGKKWKLGLVTINSKICNRPEPKVSLEKW